MEPPYIGFVLAAMELGQVDGASVQQVCHGFGFFIYEYAHRPDAWIQQTLQGGGLFGGDVPPASRREHEAGEFGL